MPTGKPKPTNVPSGAEDVTQQYGALVSDIAVDIAAMISPADVMRDAYSKSYLGQLTDEDTKGLRSMSVALTARQHMMLDALADDRRFPTYTSKADVIRHFIEMGISYYTEEGLISPKDRALFVAAIQHDHSARASAERARLRREFKDTIQAHATELNDARGTGDWPYIAMRLNDFRDMLENCETESQRRTLRGVLAESVATRSAVVAFFRWINDPTRVPVEGYDESWVQLADEWNAWYQEWELE